MTKKFNRRAKGEGALFQRTDGRWCATIDLGWQDGRRRRKTYTGATQEEVSGKLLAARAAHASGLPVAPKQQTLKQFLDRWLVECVKPAVRPLTLQQYQQHVKLYLGPALGSHRLEKLAAVQVQAFLNAQLKRGLSPRTVQLSLVILRHALDTAVRWNLVARNVAKLVDAPRVQRPETRPFSPDEAREFVEAIKGKRWELVYLTALTTGLRVGEILALRWRDIDLDHRTLAVVQSVQRIRSDKEGESSKLQFVELKTSRSRRTISIPASLAGALKEHRARQLRARLAVGPKWKDHDLMFSTFIGTPIEKGALHRDFKAILEKAELPKVRIHDLRHSTASLLLAQGTHPRAIMELLGHSRIGVTMDTYAHVMPAMMADVADRMDAILRGGK